MTKLLKDSELMLEGGEGKGEGKGGGEEGRGRGRERRGKEGGGGRGEVTKKWEEDLEIHNHCQACSGRGRVQGPGVEDSSVIPILCSLGGYCSPTYNLLAPLCICVPFPPDPDLCPSYPPQLIVPICTPELDLIRGAKLYREGRFPTVCWVCRRNGAALLRAAVINAER